MNSDEEATGPSATIFPPKAHCLRTRSDDCGQDLSQDCLQFEGSFEEDKEESIVEDFVDRTCGCKVGSENCHGVSTFLVTWPFSKLHVYVL